MANTGYSVGRNDIITETLELLGALEEGGTPSANQITSLARTLNMLIKHWQGQGINMFAVRETFLFLLNGVGTYNQLDFDGTTGLDVDRNHIYVSEYQTVTFAESSTTVVTVNESFITGSPVASAVATDVIGIPLADGTMHWAEITAVGTAGAFSKSYTFASHALTLSTDPDITKKLVVATVYPGRPIKILASSIRQFYDATEKEISVVSLSDYNRLPSKTSAGEPNQIMYNRETTTGDLRTWPVNDTEYKVLVLLAQVPLSDIEADSALLSNTGFPQEYFLALAYSLAEAASPKYGPPPDTLKAIKALAGMFREEAFSYDTGGDISFQPDGPAGG